MFDDLVLGIAGQVIGHQYKSSTKPKAIGIRRLLLGTDKAISDCAKSFKSLVNAYPGKHVTLRYVTAHFASVGDKGQFGVKDRDSKDFFRTKDQHPDWTLADWRASIWQPIIDELVDASGICEDDFERFFHRFAIEFGAPPTIDLNFNLDPAARDQVIELARAIGDLVGRDDGKTSWTRQELLDELGCSPESPRVSPRSPSPTRWRGSHGQSWRAAASSNAGMRRCWLRHRLRA